MSTRPLLALLLAPALTAQGTPWDHPDNTTHWYEVVSDPGRITWSEANREAAKAGGYLATITSSQENAFLFGLIDDAAYWTRNPTTGTFEGPWIGGVQLPGSPEPAGGWAWGELEPFSSAHWASGQPDDQGGANRIHYHGPTARAATWADRPDGSTLTAYVVEYSGPTSPRTIGLQVDRPGHAGGYVLFAPLGGHETYLLDRRGRVVHEWTNGDPTQTSLSPYLLPDGRLLRTAFLPSQTFDAGGGTGRVEIRSWDDRLLWAFEHSTSRYHLHHDVEMLPNGNVLMITWELKTRAEALAAGRDPALLLDNELWPDAIIEVRPTGQRSGQIVWEWHAWDHLIQDFDPSKPDYGNPAQHPERIDLNYDTNLNNGADDWMHSNAIDYNARLDQIVLSVRHFDEIWIIDHSTTTAEAAGSSGGRSGKGGDLLYRWGNPRAYGAGTHGDRQLFQQHDSRWIPDSRPGAGNILIFSNGIGRPGGLASSVEEIVPPTPDPITGTYPRNGGAWGPQAPAWTYQASPPTSFFSTFVSGAQRLANGNTLICGGWVGDVFEVTPQLDERWRYENPVAGGVPLPQGADLANKRNFVFRAPHYPAHYPALRGRDLTPGEPLELYETRILADGSTVARQARPGENVSLTLKAGDDNAGRVYVVATSLNPGPLPIDYRFARIGDDLLSLNAPGAASTFRNYVGVLDASGDGEATLALPPNRMIAGLRLHTTFAVVEPGVRSNIGFLANQVIVDVVP